MPMPLSPPLPLQTDRLVLRAFQDADLEPLLALRSDPEVMRYMPFDLGTREGVAASIKARRSMTALDGPDSGIVCAITDKGSGAFIGDVLLFHYDPANKCAEVGFSMLTAWHGKGIMQEAAQTLMQWGFAEAGLHRIRARTDARNLASQNTLKRLGMRQEGHEIANVVVRGEWTDTILFAVLEHEWHG